MDNLYAVPRLYPVDIDDKQPTFALGVPFEAISRSVYESVEVNHVLGFGYFRPLTDTETARNFLLFKRNIIVEGAGQNYCEEVIRVMKKSRQTLIEIIGTELIEELDTDNDNSRFWRTITSLDEEMLIALPEKLHNNHLEKDHRGAHIRLEMRDDKALLRVKTRTLADLEKMTEFAFQSLAENL